MVELNRTEENIARQLTSVRKDLVAFVQTLSKHQRNPAKCVKKLLLENVSYQ